jgi:hypothetical protein
VSPETPPPPPAEAPPPAAAEAPASAGQALLDACVADLAEGRYEDAIAKAIPAISEHPELAPSFQAVADVAADQLERRRTAPIDRDSAAGAPYASAPPPAYYPPPPPGYYGRRERARLTGGVELGLPTGFRIEWKIAQSAVDGWGFRLGGNVAFYDGTYPSFELMSFVDWTLQDSWQLETSVGLGAPYPALQVGAALQWDPPDEPVFVNIGGRFGMYGGTPDIVVGWVW